MSEKTKTAKYLLIKVVQKNGSESCESVEPILKIDSNFYNQFGDKIKLRKPYRKDTDIMNNQLGDYHLIPASGYPHLPVNFFSVFETEKA